MMADWVTHPTCLEIDVEVEETFKMPDPLWPGLGFAIAFVIGGIIGAIIAKFCLRDYLKKRVSSDTVHFALLNNDGDFITNALQL